MAERYERVRVSCPICAIRHEYRLHVKRRLINDNMFSLLNVKKPGERVLRIRVRCQRSGDPFETEVRLYETLHERIEGLEDTGVRRTRGWIFRGRAG